MINFFDGDEFALGFDPSSVDWEVKVEECDKLIEDMFKFENGRYYVRVCFEGDDHLYPANWPVDVVLTFLDSP